MSIVPNKVKPFVTLNDAVSKCLSTVTNDVFDAFQTWFYADKMISKASHRKALNAQTFWSAAIGAFIKATAQDLARAYEKNSDNETLLRLVKGTMELRGGSLHGRQKKLLMKYANFLDKNEVVGKLIRYRNNVTGHATTKIIGKVVHPGCIEVGGLSNIEVNNLLRHAKSIVRFCEGIVRPNDTYSWNLSMHSKDDYLTLLEK